MKPISLAAALYLGLILAACGNGNGSQASTQGMPAPTLFKSLPDASEVAQDEIADTYFKLITRVNAKVRAVRDQDDADAATRAIEFARAQIATLEKRSRALSAQEREQVFPADKTAMMAHARKRYARMVESIDAGKFPDFAAFADQPWPKIE